MKKFLSTTDVLLPALILFAGCMEQPTHADSAPYAASITVYITDAETSVDTSPEEIVAETTAQDETTAADETTAKPDETTE